MYLRSLVYGPCGWLYQNRGIVRIKPPASSRYPLTISTLRISLQGLLKTKFMDPHSDSIDSYTHRDKLLVDLDETLLDDETLQVPVEGLHIPFEFEMPEPPASVTSDLMRTATRIANLLPPSSTFGHPIPPHLLKSRSPDAPPLPPPFPNPPPAQAKITYALHVDCWEIATTLGIQHLKHHEHTRFLDPFVVYDPRLIPLLLQPDSKRWRSAPGDYPCEYEIEISATTLGPSEKFRVAYRLAVHRDAAKEGVRLGKVKVLLREHRWVGSQGGRMVRVSGEVTRWEADEGVDFKERGEGRGGRGTRNGAGGGGGGGGGLEMADLRPRRKMAEGWDGGGWASLYANGHEPSDTAQRRWATRMAGGGNLNTYDTLHVPRANGRVHPFADGWSSGPGGDGLYAEGDMILQTPDLNFYVPSTPRNVNTSLLYPPLSSPPYASIEVRHSIQVRIELENWKEPIVLECNANMASIGKRECEVLLDDVPHLMPSLDYDKLFGQDVWLPSYTKRDEFLCGKPGDDGEEEELTPVGSPSSISSSPIYGRRQRPLSGSTSSSILPIRNESFSSSSEYSPSIKHVGSQSSLVSVSSKSNLKSSSSSSRASISSPNSNTYLPSPPQSDPPEYVFSLPSPTLLTTRGAGTSPSTTPTQQSPLSQIPQISTTTTTNTTPTVEIDPPTPQIDHPLKDVPTETPRTPSPPPVEPFNPLSPHQLYAAFMATPEPPNTEGSSGSVEARNGFLVPWLRRRGSGTLLKSGGSNVNGKQIHQHQHQRQNDQQPIHTDAQLLSRRSSFSSTAPSEAAESVMSRLEPSRRPRTYLRGIHVLPDEDELEEGDYEGWMDRREGCMELWMALREALEDRPKSIMHPNKKTFHNISLAVYLLLLLIVLPPGARSNSAPVTCARMTSYTQCTTQAAQKSAACNSLVLDTPTLEYYLCLCESEKARVGCYDMCNNVPEIRQQYEWEMKNGIGSCRGAEELKVQGYTTFESLKSVTTTIESVSLGAETTTKGVGGSTLGTATMKGGVSLGSKTLVVATATPLGGAVMDVPRTSSGPLPTWLTEASTISGAVQKVAMATREWVAITLLGLVMLAL
ncbi:hypothetical protein HDV05_002005 [Chytridiales sp. JEL 0842]|nr:hypothetical protein HDV05_002005 [Chytridiales sp. JEL 0842]